MLVGPPLTRSAAAVLHEAGVRFGLGSSGASASHRSCARELTYVGDAALHDLPIEASWVAKHAGLSGAGAVALVSRNIEMILGLRTAKDFVVWEGDPLQFGASVVLAVDGEGGVMGCWPESN